ncbi:hypothetical protein P154DRAFT_524546 [Amniculicola lignicola CBS 123094]|uniref:DUF7730 domain-containing protein n=1 Tax=Amniculicola lignicola CBS 123094 TaxID=1392246 RepID=A0A6A5W7A3_9PLEO|nr:hypothetical protein P154DRAFT_524546 [Amniculicola lignicola CBS 123094]
MLHRDRAVQKREIHCYCPKNGQTEQCDPFHDDPRALPFPRPRQLSIYPATIPRDHKPFVWPSKSRLFRRLPMPKPASDQIQSPFFSRLPLELRRLCYVRVLCEPERTFHIYHCDGKYSYTRCREPEELDHHECWATLQDVFPGYFSGIGSYDCFGALTDAQINTSDFKRNINLNMLLACRRVYVEAVDLLYSENAFSFNSGRRLNVFLTTVLSHRFDAIRRLSINWTRHFWKGEYPFLACNSLRGGSDEIHAWDTLCSRIAKMPYLRHFCCALRVAEVLPPHAMQYYNLRPQFNGEREKELLDALKQISRPEHFEVLITWEQLPNSITKIEEFPFTILWMNKATFV